MEIGRRTSAVEHVFAVEVAQSVKELVAKQGAQCGDGQQEERVAGVDPSLVVG
jgi:hypothetical protein